jgi:hypothetical protein
MNSVDFLRQMLKPSVVGANPMIYLDAHWYRYFPLPDELSLIARSCRKAVVVIDDFFVPFEPRFGYDEYGGVRIGIELIEKHVKRYREDVVVYYPMYDPAMEPGGKARGMGLFLLGDEQPLPSTAFPFNLLRLTRV